MAIELRCEQCGAIFKTWNTKAVRRFCSRACYRASTHGAGNHNWKGDPQHRRSDGYWAHGDGSLEHRRRLLARIGPGPHPCHWCGTAVDWMPGARTAQGALIVDHIDGNKSNNALGNLVPSCHRCNCRRSNKHVVQDDEIFAIGGHGRRVRALEKRCTRCGITFRVPITVDRAGNGRFCSRACARQHEAALRASRRQSS